MKALHSQGFLVLWGTPRIGVAPRMSTANVNRARAAPIIGDVTEPTNEIDEIKKWFAEKGYNLVTHEFAGEWRAPYMRTDVPVGTAAYGSGDSELAAARDARARFEVELAHGAWRKPDIEDSGALLMSVTASGVARVSAELSVTPAPEKPIGEETIRTLEGFGWRLWFEPDPDGQLRWFVFDVDTEEILTSGVGYDFDDAILDLAAQIRPPSDEVRKERGRNDPE